MPIDQPAALANAVSAYATILSGVLALILTALMGMQPPAGSSFICA